MMYRLLLAALAAGPALASPEGNLIFARQAASTCNRDNLYRCFTASSAQAAPYCATAVAASTVTASTTITPTATATATATVFVTTTGSQTATVSSTTTAVETSVVTSTFLSTTTFSTTTTATTTTATPLLNKRQANGPACLTRDGSKSTSYPVSRITSACNCLYPKTSTTTPVAAPTTITVTQTVMPTTTVTVTSTSTVPVTATSITTSVIAISSTATTTAVSTTVSLNTVTYTKKGEGSGCVYNRYYRYENIPVSQSADGRYQGSVDACTKLCTDDARCKQFMLNIDTDKFNAGQFLAFCVIDDQPYQTDYLQCGVNFVAYFRDYEKN